MVFRVEKNKDYVCMSNRHLREKDMSLKAKGLLSWMLSNTDDWNYSIEGIIANCKENKCAIRAILDELKTFGYLEIRKLKPEKGVRNRLEYEYVIHENPINIGNSQHTDFQYVEKQDVEKQDVENQVLINNKKINTNKINNKEDSISKDILCEQPLNNNFNFGSVKEKQLSKSQQDKLLSEEFVNLFKEYCPSLGNIRNINDTRVRLIKTLYKKFSKEDIIEGLIKAESSNFLTGKTTDWKANFDWIIKESSFTKILEGNYDNRKKPSNNYLKNEQVKDPDEELDYSMRA